MNPWTPSPKIFAEFLRRDCNESHEEAAGIFIRAIRELNARMGIPTHLEDIAPEDIPVMAAHAEQEANPLYPVPRLMTKEELESFYYQVSAVPEAV